MLSNVLLAMAFFILSLLFALWMSNRDPKPTAHHIGGNGAGHGAHDEVDVGATTYDAQRTAAPAVIASPRAAAPVAPPAAAVTPVAPPPAPAKPVDGHGVGVFDTSRSEQPTVEPTMMEPVASSETPTGDTQATDDLIIIEGIGPKITSLLQANGITTFKQLAEVEIERLEKILLDANLRLADPGSWKEQARLAAGGEWEALKSLQDRLKGGRQV